jgi:hypothetical protein
LFALAACPPLTERAYRVDAADTCTGTRCSGCTHRADILLRFESTETEVCVDEVRPVLRVGEQMIVRGYFHPLIIHIDSVQRVPGTTPTSAP